MFGVDGSGKDGLASLYIVGVSGRGRRKLSIGEVTGGC